MAATLRPRRGSFRAFVNAIRTKKTAVSEVSRDDATTSTATAGRGFPKLSEATLGVLQREYDMQKDDRTRRNMPILPLCPLPVQRFVEDVFVSTCGLAPPAVVAEVQTHGRHILHGAFSELASACQDCLNMDVNQRLEALCSRMSQWSNAAQTVLAAILAETSTATEEDSTRRCHVGAAEHQAACTIFALQLKLQASARLMDNQYVRRVVDDSKQMELNVSQRGDREHGVEASAAINASIFRRACERVDPADGDRGGATQHMALESSCAINASVFRRARNRILQAEGESDNTQSVEDLPGMPEASSAINASIFRTERSKIAAQAETDSKNISSETKSAMSSSIVHRARSRNAIGEGARVDIEPAYAALRPTYPTLLSTSARQWGISADPTQVSSSGVENIEMPGCLQCTNIDTPKFSVS